jgi:enamine deaminase RidA (YjgF/YER057c/UK114 family)
MTSPDGRQRWTDGRWEQVYGYSRVLRVGPHVYVAGTTAAGPDGVVAAPGYPAGEAAVILERIHAALRQVGASIDDVVRTRVYVVDGVDTDGVLRAHGEVFARARPAASLVVVQALLTPEMLVEIEADAYVGRPTAR